MAPLPVCFLFTGVQRPEFPILSMPFRQRCTARQVAVLTPMGQSGAARRRSAPRRRNSRPTRPGQRSAGPTRSLLEANLGDRSIVHETGVHGSVVKPRSGHHHAESPLVR
jgi:hypothetical protein